MRRTALIGLSLLLLIAAGWLVSAEIDRDGRHWQATYAVDLPEGWTIGERTIRAHSGTAQLSGPAERLGGRLDFGRVECELTVDAPGGPMAVPRGTTRVRVGDRAARFVARPDSDDRAPYGLFWRGPDGTRARLACERLTLERTLLLAARVRFASTPLAVPARLARIPGGYRARSIVSRSPSEPPRLVLDANDPFLPRLAAWVNDAGDRPAPPGDHVSVGGRSARMRSADRLLCFDGTPALCVSEDVVDLVGEDSAWAPGEREALIELAGQLIEAPDLADPSTWFEGRDAFPASLSVPPGRITG